MNYADYIKSISFRYLQPDIKAKPSEAAFANLKISTASFEVENTIIPENADLMRDRMSELLGMPRMSTYALAALINKGVSELDKDCCYLNIGVWHGFTFLAGIMGNPDKICIGVDNFSGFGGPRRDFLDRFGKHKSPNHHFYEMDYRDYFSTIHREKIGFYVYDGDHSYDCQLEALQIADPFFSEGAYIFLDDANWRGPRQATMDFVTKSNGSYEVLFDKRTAQNGHPTLWNGIIILRKGNR
jgi:hypothetical protein